MFLWNVGMGLFNRAEETVTGFARGLVQVNSELEQSTQTFSAVYGSAEKGRQAVAWLDDFAQPVPATRQEVISAGLALASMGDNIGEVLPRLANVASGDPFCRLDGAQFRAAHPDHSEAPGARRPHHQVPQCGRRGTLAGLTGVSALTVG